MANFKAQIESLAGATTDSEINQWMNDGAKEIINILPQKLKHKSGTITSLANSTPMDMDAVGEILHVTRLSADSGGYRIPCREMNPMYSGLATDSSSLHYASATDPVYWTESNSSGNPTLFVKPTPDANQPAKIMHISYPVFDADGSGSNVNIKTATSIANFPDEAEYLVPLRAAITAAEYQLAIEEDVELYMPIIATLKAQYQEGILALQTGSIIPQQKRGQ